MSGWTDEYMDGSMDWMDGRIERWMSEEISGLLAVGQWQSH